jgi:hypothetical protein
MLYYQNMKIFLIAIILFFNHSAFAKSILPTCKGADIKKYNNCFGEQALTNGDKYAGEYKNGLPHGNGTYTLANGSKYVGEFKKGLSEGKGTATYAEGGKYVGEFKNGKPHGQGIATYANGEKYIGEHKESKRTGKGTYIDTKGLKTLGEWKDNNLEEEKANRLLASMKPEERRAHICEKTYGFRKGSDKFSECVYKILAADIELEKLELQKKLAESQLETAKANEAAARANAAANASRNNVPAYDPAIGRAAERAQELETARLAFELARQLNPQRYAPQQQNNIQFPKQQYCKLNPINNRISCYTQ